MVCFNISDGLRSVTKLFSLHTLLKWPTNKLHHFQRFIFGQDNSCILKTMQHSLEYRGLLYLFSCNLTIWLKNKGGGGSNKSLFPRGTVQSDRKTEALVIIWKEDWIKLLYSNHKNNHIELIPYKKTICIIFSVIFLVFMFMCLQGINCVTLIYWWELRTACRLS